MNDEYKWNQKNTSFNKNLHINSSIKCHIPDYVLSSMGNQAFDLFDVLQMAE